MATPQRKDLLDYDKPDPSSAGSRGAKGGAKDGAKGGSGASKGDQSATGDAVAKQKKKHASGSGMNKKAMLAMLGVVLLLGAVAAYMNLYADKAEQPTAEELKELTTPPPPHVVPGKPVPRLDQNGTPIPEPENQRPPMPA